MAGTTEIIKEYLVQLGFSVDNTAQAQIKKALAELEKNLNALSQNKAFNILVKGASAYIAAIATVVTASAQLMHKAAEADMEYKKLGLRMHMTAEAAYAFTSAQKALNASIEEIVWIPELRKHYHELKNLALELGSSPEAKEQFKKIRETGFEFTKLQFIIKRLGVSVAADLAKALGGGEKLRKFVANINKWLKENFEEISKKVADVLRRIIGVGEVIIKIFVSLYEGIKAVIKVLPDAAQGFTLFFAAIAMGLKLNPTIVLLGTLFALMEDYWVWMQGIENKDPNKVFISKFGGMWASLSKMFAPLKKSLLELKDALGVLEGENIKTFFWKSFEGVVRSVASGIVTIVMGLGTIARIASHFIQMHMINEKYRKEAETFFQPELTGAAKQKAQLEKEYPEYAKGEFVTDVVGQAKIAAYNMKMLSLRARINMKMQELSEPEREKQQYENAVKAEQMFQDFMKVYERVSPFQEESAFDSGKETATRSTVQGKVPVKVGAKGKTPPEIPESERVPVDSKGYYVDKRYAPAQAPIVYNLDIKNVTIEHPVPTTSEFYQTMKRVADKQRVVTKAGAPRSK